MLNLPTILDRTTWNSETSLPNRSPKKEKRVALTSLNTEGKGGGFNFPSILSKIEAWRN